MGMLTSPFWLKLLWVLHLRLGMSTGAAQPLEDEQEPAQDLEEVANTLHTQHYGPQSPATRCSWCLAACQLQTIQHHSQFGDGWAELYLCSRCTVLWQLWEVLACHSLGSPMDLMASCSQCGRTAVTHFVERRCEWPQCLAPWLCQRLGCRVTHRWYYHKGRDPPGDPVCPPCNQGTLQVIGSGVDGCKCARVHDSLEGPSQCIPSSR